MHLSHNQYIYRMAVFVFPYCFISAFKVQKYIDLSIYVIYIKNICKKIALFLIIFLIECNRFISRIAGAVCEPPIQMLS